MRTHLTSLLLGTAALVATATVGPAPALAAPAPSPEPDGIRIVDLPLDLGLWDINDQGQVLAQEPGTGGDIVVVEEGAVAHTVGPWEPFPNPLCGPGPICVLPSVARADVNEHGVVGTSISGRASLWDDGEVTDLNGDAVGSWVLALNDRGQVLVTRFMADHLEVGVWHRGRFATVGTWPLDRLVVGRISERGDVVLTILAVRPPTPTLSAVLWRRGVTTPLDGFVPRGVNDRGQIVGQKVDPASPGGGAPVLWEAGELTVLPTLGGEGPTSPTYVNDRGQIVGTGTAPGAVEPTVVLWDDGEIVDIGAAVGGRHLRPLGLSSRGEVLITGYSSDLHAIGAVWERGEVRLLPPSGEPGADAEPSLFNDRGQVVGRRSLPGAGPFLTTLWEL